ncbi:MAG: 50S ribosomal protein L21e [Thermoplasmata archaeon]|nr:MAG: 50S ribosomal protein L21e [Thermoplasmata archaeon]RLF63594.1 MAG: 50S ribosomal protein L21e [Thermoplasmata archaeon]
MARRSRGIRSKTRQVLRKKPREKGMSPITRALQEFEKGEKVSIVIDPSVQKGMPHRRFQGKTGDIEDKRGDAYVVRVKVGNAMKSVIVRPEHLKKV